MCAYASASTTKVTTVAMCEAWVVIVAFVLGAFFLLALLGVFYVILRKCGLKLVFVKEETTPFSNSSIAGNPENLENNGAIGMVSVVVEDTPSICDPHCPPHQEPPATAMEDIQFHPSTSNQTWSPNNQCPERRHTVGNGNPTRSRTAQKVHTSIEVYEHSDRCPACTRANTLQRTPTNGCENFRQTRNPTPETIANGSRNSRLSRCSGCTDGSIVWENVNGDFVIIGNICSRTASSSNSRLRRPAASPGDCLQDVRKLPPVPSPRDTDDDRAPIIERRTRKSLMPP